MEEDAEEEEESDQVMKPKTSISCRVWECIEFPLPSSSDINSDSDNKIIDGGDDGGGG
jgi:hypothetical protein